MTKRLGTPGYLVIFLWSLGAMTLTDGTRLLLAAGACLSLAGVLFPGALRALLRLRWLAALGLLALVNALWGGPPDLSVGAISYSSAGLAAGGQMALRALVLLVMVDGFSSSAEISAVAGLLERAGLRGLGFSLGIAVNLLPGLRQASANTWQSLWMRGGLRSRRWRGLQLYAVTVVANALRRAEEIALAAETRAFSPEQARRLPVHRGDWDIWVAVAAGGSLLGIILGIG
jgi:energy-coupling factor transporter transmembrane protein EcfT